MQENTETVDRQVKKRFWKGYALGILTVLILLAGLLLGINSVYGKGLSLKESFAALVKIQTLTSYLNEKCLEETENRDLLEGAYTGLVDTVDDKYTRYYTKEAYEEYLEDISGSYAGIGVSVQWDTEEEMLKIVGVTEEGPGSIAGLCVGDWVYAVDDVVVQGTSSDETIRLIKGEEDTKVKITVIREGATLELDIIRQVIYEESVFYHMVETSIGYIQLTAFDKVTTNQFKEAIETLKEQGMESLILDLRENPGGSLQTSIDIADMLLPEGTITYTEDKQGKKEYYSSDAESLGIPLVVLINEGSASASEILAGSIQDLNAGTLIGMTTFGKGIVQSTYSLYDGSAIKLTMAKYYTPSGRYIHGEGIKPDIEIDLPEGVYLEEVYLTEEDIQFQTALEAARTMIAS